MSDESEPNQTAIVAEDLAFIQQAVAYLERPSFLMRVANLLGKPIESVSRVLPASVRSAAGDVVDYALRQALEAALLTLRKPRGNQLSGPIELDRLEQNRWERLKHNMAAGFTGALAGTFGIKALALELPITTTIMMRDIAGVALSCGEDPTDESVKLQCMAVFSIGGMEQEQGKSAMESSYYASRLTLTNLIREATLYASRVSAEQLAGDLAAGSSPALVRLVAEVAKRFNVVVSQKLMAQAVPAIGAAGGALVNVAFNAHFDRVARYHFGIRALERKYGPELVQKTYQTTLGSGQGA
jgi:hypothetical protein